MSAYLMRRALQMIPILVGISVVVFALLAAAPGDQVDLLLSAVPNVTPDDVARLKHVYGFDEPIHVRYFKWLGRAVQGDFGWSRTYREPVAGLILDRLGNTVLLAKYMGGSVAGIVFVISLFAWSGVARLVRGEVLKLKDQDFTDAVRALGATDRRILIRHLIPNSLSPVIVAATLIVGGAILTEAALSFLGIGIQPPIPSWGNMLQNAQDLILSDPRLAIFPGLMIFLTVLCFNFLGDGLRDALDPRLKL
jgi:ABC-type dipeptide/oligopeptide/nickel transport system permease component